MSLRRFWQIAICAGVAALMASFAFAGTQGLEGMALGISGATFNLWALRAIIGLATANATSELGRRKGTLYIVLAFFIKLPLFIALGVTANRVGGPAPSCFLLGLGLVYFGLVGWSLARR